MQPLGHPQGYYRKREQQEREMAANTKDHAARQIHLDLAEKYRKLVDGEG
jgi:hypothetical protein